jgi:enamine deaminase RidA (YjgF/YER057c/UK114 family)
VVQTGNLLYVSGQVPQRDGKPMVLGKLGQDVSIDDAAACARQCALQALAAVRERLGSLDRVLQAVRVAGYVASAEGFTDHPKVINGASQLLIDVFGEAGRSARIAIGVAELPFGVPVEVEFVFEVG